MLENEYVGDTLPVEINFKLKNCIFNYIKRNNVNIGLILACKFNTTNNVAIGWALCHKNDVFDKQQAFDLALYRAYTDYLTDDRMLQKNEDYDIPSSIQKDFNRFIIRAKKYYKLDKTIYIYSNTDDIELVTYDFIKDLFSGTGNFKTFEVADPVCKTLKDLLTDYKNTTSPEMFEKYVQIIKGASKTNGH